MSILDSGDVHVSNNSCNPAVYRAKRIAELAVNITECIKYMCGIKDASELSEEKALKRIKPKKEGLGIGETDNN